MILYARSQSPCPRLTEALPVSHVVAPLAVFWLGDQAMWCPDRRAASALASIQVHMMTYCAGPKWIPALFSSVDRDADDVVHAMDLIFHQHIVDRDEILLVRRPRHDRFLDALRAFDRFFAQRKFPYFGADLADFTPYRSTGNWTGYKIYSSGNTHTCIWKIACYMAS